MDRKTKSLTGVLATCLCLLLALLSPVATRATPSESLPIGAKARLGRGTVVAVQYSPDGTRLAVGGSVGIWLYDTRTYEVVSLIPGHDADALGFSFSPDARTLVGGDQDGIVRLWDVTTGNFRHALEGHTVGIDSVAFSPDGRTLASGGWNANETVHLWDAATGILRYSLQGHPGYVRDLAFSHDSRTLASSSHDDTILLWNVVSDAAMGDFRNLATNPDGRWAVWKSGTTVTAHFSSPHAPVQYQFRSRGSCCRRASGLRTK